MTVGETFTALVTFTDADGVLYDPDTVTGNVLEPDSTSSSATVTATGVGTYQVSFLMDQVGIWRLQIVGDGPDDVIVIEETSVCASPSLVAV